MSLPVSIMFIYHMWIVQEYYPHTAPCPEDVAQWNQQRGTRKGRPYKLHINRKSDNNLSTYMTIKKGANKDDTDQPTITLDQASRMIEIQLASWDTLITKITNGLVQGNLQLPG